MNYSSDIAILDPVHTAPFSFLSIFVDENAVRSHCSVFKWIRYENDRRSHCSSKTVLLIPFSKQCLLLAAVKKAPIANLNATVINSLSTNEFEAFSNISVFGVHTENRSFSKHTVFKFVFVSVFKKLNFHSGAIWT